MAGGIALPSSGLHVSAPSSDTVTVSLQASTVAKAGLLSQALGVKALDLLPEKPRVGVGGEEREGPAQDHCWKGINSPKVSSNPQPRLGLHCSALSPTPHHHHCEWASGGALGWGGPQGKGKGFSGNPHTLTEVSHQEGPMARAPGQPKAQRQTLDAQGGLAWCLVAG